MIRGGVFGILGQSAQLGWFSWMGEVVRPDTAKKATPYSLAILLC